jgi:hypothetical protein
MPPVLLKELISALANVVLIAVQRIRGRRLEGQRQIQIGVRPIVAQRVREVRRKIGIRDRAEAAADAAGGEDGVLLDDVAAGREAGVDRRAAQGGHARNGGERRRGRIDVDQIGRRCIEPERAVDRHRRPGRAVAGRERAAGN